MLVYFILLGIFLWVCFDPDRDDIRCLLSYIPFGNRIYPAEVVWIDDSRDLEKNDVYFSSDDCSDDSDESDDDDDDDDDEYYDADTDKESKSSDETVIFVARTWQEMELAERRLHRVPTYDTLPLDDTQMLPRVQLTDN